MNTLKKVLITGVAGFLGSHLAKELIKKEYQVIGIDNLSTGRMENISSIKNRDNFTFIMFDVSLKDVLSIPDLQEVHEIYHLASPASPKFYQSIPLETIAVNTLGTKNMLDLAKNNHAKVVYSSTSEIYGDPLIHPQYEEYRGNVNSWGPRACYDESKRLGEVYCYEYHRCFKIRVKVARLFNTYSAGLRNDDGRVISNFVYQALLGKDITIYGDGSQTRPFCYIDDTIKALQLLMEKDKANGEVINIGNPKEYTILKLANLIKKLTKSKSNITFHPLPIDDPKVRCPVIEKAKHILDWEPTIDLEEGLKETIKMYKKEISQ